MAAFEINTRSAPFGAVTISSVVQSVERAARAFRAKFVADRTYRELSKLSQSQLRDIGLGDQDLNEFCRRIASRRV
ncbi:DUF1127 domain-containing protein [Pikeienuella piscinae]|uniref:DUF1127 domain-containing protein n=1 Tax=Pikeienuella piscinae TaxID=2748098 RepID=A0A7L5BW07_9RHOB|nr:DUF1127 domain-containing protein [Pikeienuella piscinae]QIE55313.1 DUF1127 domain-containing protein [Pikeienuella piscinae]